MAIVGDVSIESVLRQVSNRLQGALAGARVVTLEDMTEGIPDTPMVEVYDDEVEPVTIERDGTQQIAYVGGVMQLRLVVNVDVYARQRSHIGEDQLSRVQICDRIVNVLQQETRKPYFGQAGLQAFTWRGERAIFDRGGNESPVRFVGNRFVLTFRIF